MAVFSVWTSPHFSNPIPTKIPNPGLSKTHASKITLWAPIYGLPPRFVSTIWGHFPDRYKYDQKIQEYRPKEPSRGSVLAVAQGRLFVDKGYTYMRQTPNRHSKHLRTRCQIDISCDWRLRSASAPSQTNAKTAKKLQPRGTHEIDPNNDPTTQKNISGNSPEWGIFGPRIFDR